MRSARMRAPSIRNFPGEADTAESYRAFVQGVHERGHGFHRRVRAFHARVHGAIGRVHR